MNIAPLCVLIIITAKTDGFHVERTPLKEPEERIPPRKLHSFEHNDPRDAKTATWNQILADALVNRIKVFSFNKVTENEKPDVEVNSFLTNCISQMMHLYKTLIYDNVNGHTKVKSDTNVDIEVSGEKAQSNAEKVNIETEKDAADPKDEVEIIEPKYHGKLCADCEGNAQNDRGGPNEENAQNDRGGPNEGNAQNERNGTSEIVKRTELVTTVTCPSGLVASEGGCTNPKSKFILSIPYQCPIGYRRDWLGFCRPQL